MNKEQYSSWLAGFIDAEGNFQVYLDRLYLRVMFRIRLHKDDIDVLQKIQAFLGVGRVAIEGNSCVFIISNVKDLITVLFPLLDKYNLFTTKWLDYIDFKQAVLFISDSKTTKVPLTELERIKDMISKMNLGRADYNYSLMPKVVVNPFWLLGFIEGEGTFGFKNLWGSPLLFFK